MKHIFVDTNIVVDLLADRKPFSKYAISLFAKAEKKKVKLFTSSHTLATTYYLLQKHIDEKHLRLILLGLQEYLEVIAVDGVIIKKALKSKHKVFEDAIQIYCATTVEKMDCILTRNVKDFKLSEIDVLSPEALLRQLK